MRLPRNRWVFLVFDSALIFALASYNGFGQVVHLRPGNAAVVPISFWAFYDFRLAALALLQDLEASGGRIYLHFDGAHQQFGPDFVRRFTAAVNSPQPEVVVPFSRPASLLIYGAAVADALLDARGLWDWLWIVWAIVCVFTVRTRRRP
jgi:hypothetical protein